MFLFSNRVSACYNGTECDLGSDHGTNITCKKIGGIVHEANDKRFEDKDRNSRVESVSGVCFGHWTMTAH